MMASMRRRVWRNGRARAALMVIGAIAVASVASPLLTAFDPTVATDIVKGKHSPPSWNHWLGTDGYSRDLLSRVLMGGRVSLAVATLAVVISGTIGTAYGMVAGYFGGLVDAVLMRFLDALLSIPRVLLLVTILYLWSPVPLPALIIVIGVTGWFGVSRLVRAEVLTARDREYVTAARSLGASRRRIILRHILPNVAAPVIVAATLGIANVIALEAGLSFLGVGVRPPDASWGTILYDGIGTFGSAWWVALFPSIAIVATVLAFNVLGDALRDVLDARQLPPAESRTL
jgi:peptide/nickel transport system permease protein